MKVSWDDSSQYMEKLKKMLETTNQLLVVSIAMFNLQTIHFGDAVASVYRHIGTPRRAIQFSSHTFLWGEIRVE